MLLIGLTGSIAMGKSHVARLFLAAGVPVFDADQAVHALLAPGGAGVDPVLARFAGVADAAGGIDRAALGRLVLGAPAELRALEAILHPLVHRAERRFLEAAERRRCPVVVLDIPLLFETASADRVDLVVVVGCSAAIQAERALRRPGMTPEKLERIRGQQRPMAEKRRRADWFLPSGFDRGQMQARIRALLDAVADRPGRIWPERHGLARRRVERRQGERSGA